MSPQQATIKPAPMEGVKRMNVVIVRGQEQGMGTAPRRDLYAMGVDRGRNCYTCRGFGHMAQHCRNQGRMTDRRRLEYGEGKLKRNYEYENHLKEEENLESLN